MQFYVAFTAFDFTADLGILAGLVMFVGGSFAVIVPTPTEPDRGISPLFPWWCFTESMPQMREYLLC